ncbi:MAG: signal recognition particle-docking protein FtsY, partial [Propionibacterium sp.]
MGDTGRLKAVEWLFWTILVLVALSIVVASVIVWRSNRQLPPGPPTEEITAEPKPVSPAEPIEKPETVVESPAVEPYEPTQPVVEQPVIEQPSLEVPEAPTSRFARLRRRLAGSNNQLARALADLLSVDRLDADVWDDFEATLIASDLGVGPTTELTDALRKELSVDGVSDPAKAKQVLRSELIRLVDPSLDRSLNTQGAENKPGVVLVVGVNGVGKTTTVGKLARVLVAEDKSVLLGAADTFRAAAADQLTTWGDRVGVATVRGPEGSDPGSVAFETIDKAITDNVD